MPMRLDDGWNQIQFNLADFTRRAYGTNYVETLRVQIHANCRIRRVYFSDRLYSEEELPAEFKLYLPVQQVRIFITFSVAHFPKDTGNCNKEVHKFHNFSFTEILRETKVGESRSSKMTVIALLGSLNFVNLVQTYNSGRFQKGQKWIKIKI